MFLQKGKSAHNHRVPLLWTHLDMDSHQNDYDPRNLHYNEYDPRKRNTHTSMSYLDKMEKIDRFRNSSMMWNHARTQDVKKGEYFMSNWIKFSNLFLISSLWLDFFIITFFQLIFFAKINILILRNKTINQVLEIWIFSICTNI